MFFKHRFFSETPNTYISLLKNYKITRQDNLRPPVESTQFYEKNLCVCHHIDVYLKRKKAWRKMKDNYLVL